MKHGEHSRLLRLKPRVYAFFELVSVPKGYLERYLDRGMEFRNGDIVSNSVEEQDWSFYRVEEDRWYRIPPSYLRFIEYRLHIPSVDGWLSLGKTGVAPSFQGLITRPCTEQPTTG